MILLLASYMGDDVKEDEVGKPCGRQWAEERGALLGYGG
jgi:hypothetical protein